VRALLLVMVLGTLIVPHTWRHAWSEEFPIQPFFGRYEGRTLFPMGEPRNRDLLVLIQPAGLFGFTVEWHTAIFKSKNEIVRKIQALEFEPSTRPNLYSAKLSGQQVDKVKPAGPVDGKPYAWASISGQTLTVSILTILDDGDYVIQTYLRTLTKDGMSVDFVRLRNGKVERQIKAELKRVGEGK
jgi:hypothetical protein